MNYHKHWRELLGITCVWIFAAFAAMVPIAVSAATNHAPIISSDPETAVSVDQEYSYNIQATDRDGDPLSITISQGPKEMTLEDTTLQWQPTTDGSYNVVIEVSDQNGGYDTQSWQINVTTGKPHAIIITPNERPTIVNIGNHQEFTANVYDQYDNQISNPTIEWSTDQAIGMVDQNGVFVAEKGGTGFVAATSGEIKSSIGVVVKDIRTDLANEQETTDDTPASDNNNNTNTAVLATTNTNTTNTNTETMEEETADEEVLGEETMSEDESDEAMESEDECTNWPHWVIVITLILYGIILITFFIYERKEKISTWWIFPILLTIIGLILFNKYFCDGTYVWWPWVLIGIGLVVTAMFKYRRKRKSGSDDSQTELPF